MNYEAVIGLEVHVQLKTASKIFCGCATGAGAEPNTQVCPVCLGYPGVMPVMNEEAIRKSIVVGLMLGSEISKFSKWDRKNYFYPDMPKNYQISQYDLPLCVGGTVTIKLEDGTTKKLGVTRAHLEEDVAKSFHFATTSGVDFNRAGTPLLEIVSEPEMRSPEDAFAYLTALREMLVAAGVSDCDMEKGQMRCDANVSVRPVGQAKFGEKIEIKNLNSISGVKRALMYEIQRQTAALTKGEKLFQETRRWDDDAGVTAVMRTKEYAHDYRYFPEPDLMPVAVGAEMVAEARKLLPELPEAKRQRLVAEYGTNGTFGTDGVTEYDVAVMVASGAAAYFEKEATASKKPKEAANWIMSVPNYAESPLKDGQISQLIEFIKTGKISSKQAKDVFAEMFATGKDAGAIVKEKGLSQVNDTGALEAFADEAIAKNAKSVADFKAGNEGALNFLKGQVMKLSKGKANPQLVGEILLRKLRQP